MKIKGRKVAWDNVIAFCFCAAILATFVWCVVLIRRPGVYSWLDRITSVEGTTVKINLGDRGAMGDGDTQGLLLLQYGLDMHPTAIKFVVTWRHAAGGGESYYECEYDRSRQTLTRYAVHRQDFSPKSTEVATASKITDATIHEAGSFSILIQQAARAKKRQHNQSLQRTDYSFARSSLRFRPPLNSVVGLLRELWW